MTIDLKDNREIHLIYDDKAIQLESYSVRLFGYIARFHIFDHIVIYPIKHSKLCILYLNIL